MRVQLTHQTCCDRFVTGLAHTCTLCCKPRAGCAGRAVCRMLSEEVKVSVQLMIQTCGGRSTKLLPAAECLDGLSEAPHAGRAACTMLSEEVKVTETHGRRFTKHMMRTKTRLVLPHP